MRTARPTPMPTAMLLPALMLPVLMLAAIALAANPAAARGPTTDVRQVKMCFENRTTAAAKYSYNYGNHLTGGYVSKQNLDLAAGAVSCIDTVSPIHPVVKVNFLTGGSWQQACEARMNGAPTNKITLLIAGTPPQATCSFQ